MITLPLSRSLGEVYETEIGRFFGLGGVLVSTHALKRDREGTQQMSSPKRFTPLIKEMIRESARKCFDALPIVPYRTGNKLLRQKPIGPMAVHYYLPDLTKSFKKISPDFQTPAQELRANALYQLERRGKGPPKKGQGKRATKKR